MGGDENLGVAFALVIGAGASTAVGASVVFFPALVKYASKKTLAGGLGLSAGVMTYVSFVEIFQKSVIGFTDAGIEDDKAYIYATLCFFAGIVLMMVSYVQASNVYVAIKDHHHADFGKRMPRKKGLTEPVFLLCCASPSPPQVLNFVVHSLLLGSHDHHHDHPEDKESDGKQQQHDNNSENDGAMPPCCVSDPAANLERVQKMGQELEEHDNNQTTFKPGEGHNTKRSTEETDRVEEDGISAEEDRISREESQKLNKMSLNTAIAIGLHNFPEGLATFVAALGDPAVGAVLAIAIAIHNVPEGKKSSVWCQSTVLAL